MDDHKEVDFRRYGIRLGEYCSKLLPGLTGEWLERLISVPGVMIANSAVPGAVPSGYGFSVSGRVGSGIEQNTG